MLKKQLLCAWLLLASHGLSQATQVAFDANFSFDHSSMGSGWFEAFDLNADGLLHFDEWTAFSFQDIYGYSLGLSALTAAGAFDLAQGVWHADAPSWPSLPDNAWFSWSDQGMPGSVNLFNAQVVVTTVDGVSPSVVAEPEPAMLLATGLALLLLLGRRRGLRPHSAYLGADKPV